jgi:hypothetical protein
MRLDSASASQAPRLPPEDACPRQGRALSQLLSTRQIRGIQRDPCRHAWGTRVHLACITFLVIPGSSNVPNSLCPLPATAAFAQSSQMHTLQLRRSSQPTAADAGPTLPDERQRPGQLPMQETGGWRGSRHTAAAGLVLLTPSPNPGLGQRCTRSRRQRRQRNIASCRSGTARLLHHGSAGPAPPAVRSLAPRGSR